MIERGDLVLPEMQRRYVWRSTQVRDLLDSLYRGYPTGSVLMWESDLDIPTRSLAVEQKISQFQTRKLLLDGQQRLTSLAAVLTGIPVKVKDKKKPIEILFNLDHPENQFEGIVDSEQDEDVVEFTDLELGEEPSDDEEEESIADKMKRRTFIVASKAFQQLPNWVPVTQVFQDNSESEILRRAGIKGFDDSRYDRYRNRLQKLREIRNRLYVVHILEKELPYEEVAEIFVRVNSLGVKLRSSDLALAQITCRWPNSLKLLEGFSAECDAGGLGIDVGNFVRALVVFATKQCLFKGIGNISLATLESSWKLAKKHMEFALNFLRVNAGIEHVSLLASPFIVITVAVFHHMREGVLTDAETKALLRWFYVANARGRYSRGSSETLLNQDLAILFRGGAISELLDLLKGQFGRLHLEPSDFVGKGVNSPLFAMSFIALRAAGAQDWQSGLGISLIHQGKIHAIQAHHIFPKALLKNHYERAEINEIANMAFVGGQTNQRIGGKKAPVDYFPKVIDIRGLEALTSQAIPIDKYLWTLTAYREFLKARREQLCERVNEHIEKAAGITPEEAGRVTPVQTAAAA